jgi:hypothetical protein
MNDFTGLSVFKSNNLYIKLYRLSIKWKDNSPSSWQYENDVSEALKAAFHTAKARKKRRKRKY